MPRKEARLGVWVHVCVGAGVGVGAGEEHTQLFLFPPFRLFLNMLHGRTWRDWFSPPGRNEKAYCATEGLVAGQESVPSEGEEKGRGGGWGGGPEIAGGRRERERPGGSRSQASGQQEVWVASCSWVHRCGARGEKWGRRPGYLTQMHVLQERRRVRTSDCLLNPLECLHCALFLGPLCFPPDSFMGTCVVINTCGRSRAMCLSFKYPLIWGTPILAAVPFL